MEGAEGVGKKNSVYCSTRHLEKVTGAVQGTEMEKVNQMAGFEDVVTHLDNCQAPFVARCVEDSELGNIMPVGFGDNRMIDDEMTEEGRVWNDHGPQWVGREGKKDGFVSTLTRMVSFLPEAPLGRTLQEGG